MNNQYVAHYRDLYQHHWWWRARERAILALLDDYFRPSSRAKILDVGCGDGLLFDRLQPLGDVYGVEIDAAAVATNSPWRDHIHIGPFDETFQPATKFELILMLDVLEHMPDPVAALQQSEDLLADDGMLVLHVPAFPMLWTTHDQLNHHLTRYTRETLLAQLAKTNLQIETVHYSFHWTFLAKLAVRVKERTLGGAARLPRIPNRVVNSAAYGLCRLEHALAPWWQPSFGSSLVAVARRGVREQPVPALTTTPADSGVTAVA